MNRNGANGCCNGRPPQALTLEGIHLSKTFGSGETATQALRDVSLRLDGGQIILLMGPSGSGKSTLLAVLSGLLRPDSGRVIALGQDIWSLTDTQREHFRLENCGFIFQGYNLFPALNARQQLEIVLRWGERESARAARRRADEMLGLLGMARKATSRPIQLSGGEKQRVAIGRALIKDPALCFADEPTSALDWSHGEHVIELLREAAHERGATILVVSHDNRLIPYADQLYHLQDGRLSEAESASDQGRETRRGGSEDSASRQCSEAERGGSEDSASRQCSEAERGGSEDSASQAIQETHR